MTKLTVLEGMEPDLATRLEQVGVGSVESLLRTGATRAGRLSLCVRSGIARETIEAFVQEADLLRIRGVGRAFARRLRLAGVHSVQELAAMDQEALVDALFEVNLIQALRASPPSGSQVARWINQAKDLARVVSA